jgi:hypothetical protein
METIHISSKNGDGRDERDKLRHLFDVPLSTGGEFQTRPRELPSSELFLQKLLDTCQHLFDQQNQTRRDER